MDTLVLENIHNTVVKETMSMPTSQRVNLNSVPASVLEKTAFLTFANNLDLKCFKISYFCPVSTCIMSLCLSISLLLQF